MQAEGSLLKMVEGKWSDGLGSTYEVTIDTGFSSRPKMSCSVIIERPKGIYQERHAVIREQAGRVTWGFKFVLDILKTTPSSVRWINLNGGTGFTWSRVPSAPPPACSLPQPPPVPTPPAVPTTATAAEAAPAPVRAATLTKEPPPVKAKQHEDAEELTEAFAASEAAARSKGWASPWEVFKQRAASREEDVPKTSSSSTPSVQRSTVPEPPDRPPPPPTPPKLSNQRPLHPFKKGDAVQAYFYGEWHPAHVHALTNGKIEVLWDSEWSVSTLDVECVAFSAPAGRPPSKAPPPGPPPATALQPLPRPAPQALSESSAAAAVPLPPPPESVALVTEKAHAAVDPLQLSDLGMSLLDKHESVFSHYWPMDDDEDEMPQEFQPEEENLSQSLNTVDEILPACQRKTIVEVPLPPAAHRPVACQPNGFHGRSAVTPTPPPPPSAQAPDGYRPRMKGDGQLTVRSVAGKIGTPVYVGMVLNFKAEKNCGTICSKTARQDYNVDVYVFRTVLERASAGIGDTVCFVVHRSTKGQPQASSPLIRLAARTGFALVGIFHAEEEDNTDDAGGGILCAEVQRLFVDRVKVSRAMALDLPSGCTVAFNASMNSAGVLEAKNIMEVDADFVPERGSLSQAASPLPEANTVSTQLEQRLGAFCGEQSKPC
eukprot:TRINITY_DN12508_c0_g1_i1.p1 TRINITY_DN12508_c0_g1~~TRINITY_DN12508_c0_g1_i1.p1  ORF type:complete len:682 (+),score=134.72 TRINITY_DN12508_c0_g1_i1:75-2048(+)